MNKVLFIVEGPDDELKYIDRLFKVCNPLQKYSIVPYKTNLHNLAKLIVLDGEIDDSLDIRQVLKEQEKDPKIKEDLSQNFSDIILVFDFEPQQDHPRFELIRKMLVYFNSSTENGKLYINYPMMQSYKHFSNLPDDTFKDRIFDLNSPKTYKEIVDSVSKFKNTAHHSYSLFMSLAYHHLKKTNYILNEKYELPDISFVTEWKQEELFDLQLNMLQEQETVYVDHTFSLFLIEYNPTLFYHQITQHPSKYSI